MIRVMCRYAPPRVLIIVLYLIFGCKHFLSVLVELAKGYLIKLIIFDRFNWVAFFCYHFFSWR